jgi:U3 small nucleolar RNA-associated protein 3
MKRTFVSGAKFCTAQSVRNEYPMCLCAVFEGRDRILLDGSDPVKGKNLEDYDDEEEVFALKGIGDSDSDAGSYGDSESGNEEDEKNTEEPSVRAKSSKKTKHHEKDKAAIEEDKAASDEDAEERWGKTKSAYYSATAQEVESDDEEARELEEAEALRLQAKARETITDDDFGLNDSHSLQTSAVDA